MINNTLLITGGTGSFMHQNQRTDKKPVIVLINQTVGPLFLGIVRAFFEAGYEVYLLTGSINEGSWKLPNDIHVSKGPAYKKSTIALRLLTWGLFAMWVRFKLKSIHSEKSLFVVSNPPLAPILIPARFRKVGALIYDIYPDILASSGHLKTTNRVYTWWERKNEKVFARCRILFTIGDQMKKTLSRYVEGNKIEVIPNWADISLRNVCREKIEAFRKSFGAQPGDIVILYSGNFGLTHPVESIIEVVKATSFLPIKWVFAGAGGKIQKLRNEMAKSNIQNVIELSYQPFHMLPELLAASDIGLVLQESGVPGLSVPSKLYSLLAVGKPILAFCNPNSEMASLINTFRNGWHFSAGQRSQIIEILEQIVLKPHLVEAFGKQSRIASGEFTGENAKMYVKIWNEKVMQVG